MTDSVFDKKKQRLMNTSYIRGLRKNFVFSMGFDSTLVSEIVKSFQKSPQPKPTAIGVVSYSKLVGSSP